MKILTIVPSYKPAYMYGGPVRAIAALCESLASAGHQVTVYTTTANGAAELEVESGKEYFLDGVHVIYFERVTKGHSNLSHQLLKSLYKNVNRFDIVHIHSWWNLVTIPSTWICLLKGITPIVSPRGTLTAYTFTHRKNRIKKLFHALSGKKLLSQVALVFTSEREKEEATRFVQGKATHVLGNLLDLPISALDVHTDTPYMKLLFLGRIDPAKNLELLIKVLSDIKELPYELIIAGEGAEIYTQQIKQLTLNSNQIKWIGAVEGEEKYTKLAEADLLVLPSHTENFGNVVFEALSQGTPVMVSNHVGAKDYILINGLGWVVSGGEQEWKNALIHAWKDKRSRDEIRERAPVCIARDFERRMQVRSYIEMYMNHAKEFAG